jgi:hypothetical protein
VIIVEPSALAPFVTNRFVQGKASVADSNRANAIRIYFIFTVQIYSKKKSNHIAKYGCLNLANV